MSAKKFIDYDRIEPGWRAGVLTPRQLASAYEQETGVRVSHAAIIKHFRKHAIDRDLSERVRARAESLVTAAMVTKPHCVTSGRERDIVSQGGEALAAVRLAHRRDIARARDIVNALLGELELMSGAENAALLAQLGDLVRSPDENGADKLSDLYKRVISLPERSKTMQALSVSLRSMVDLERQAYGLDAMPVGLMDGHGLPRIEVAFVQARANEDAQ